MSSRKTFHAVRLELRNIILQEQFVQHLSLHFAPFWPRARQLHSKCVIRCRGDSSMKRSVVNLNPKRGPIWAWLYLTPKRYHRIGSITGRYSGNEPVPVDWTRETDGIEPRECCIIFSSSSPLKIPWRVKNSGVSLWTPYTKRRASSTGFHMGVPPPESATQYNTVVTWNLKRNKAKK